MRLPTRHQSHPSLIEWFLRVLRNTCVIAEISQLVAAFQAALLPYIQAYNDWKEARRNAGSARRARLNAARALDREMRGVGLTILTLFDGRRRSELYRQYFPKGYGTTLNRRPAVALSLAAGVIAALEHETNPDLRVRLDRLQAALNDFSPVLAAEQTARDVVGQKRALLEEAALAARKAFTVFYYGVKTHFSDHRSRVEELFQRPGGSSPSGTQPDGQHAPDEGSGDGGTAVTVPAPVPSQVATGSNTSSMAALPSPAAVAPVTAAAPSLSDPSTSAPASIPAPGAGAHVTETPASPVSPATEADTN